MHSVSFLASRNNVCKLDKDSSLKTYVIEKCIGEGKREALVGLIFLF